MVGGQIVVAPHPNEVRLWIGPRWYYICDEESHGRPPDVPAKRWRPIVCNKRNVSWSEARVWSVEVDGSD